MMSIKFISQYFIENKLDLILLIFLKIIFCYFAFIFFTNTLGLPMFKYPDMEAYKDCIGDGSIMVNVLYSQFLCSIGLNYEEALSGFTLIFLACVINLIAIIGFYLLFKDFLNRKGQVLFILLLCLQDRPLRPMKSGRHSCSLAAALSMTPQTREMRRPG